MKKSIILVSALSVVVMALVSCASDSDVDPMRVRADTTGPTQGPAPAHESHITGMWPTTSRRWRFRTALLSDCDFDL